MCRKCVTEEMAAEIDLVECIAADLPDGAFWAVMEEHGLDAADLEAYYEEHKKEARHERSA